MHHFISLHVVIPLNSAPLSKVTKDRPKMLQGCNHSYNKVASTLNDPS